MHFIHKNTFEYAVSKLLYFFFLKFKGNEGPLLWNLFHLLMGDPEGRSMAGFEVFSVTEIFC